MITPLPFLLISILTIPVLYTLIKEIRAYFQLNFYRKQGLMVKYKPFIGHRENYTPKKPSKESKY